MYPYVTPVHLLEQAIVSSMRKVEREEADAVAQGVFSNKEDNEVEDADVAGLCSKQEVRADSGRQVAIDLPRRI